MSGCDNDDVPCEITEMGGSRVEQKSKDFVTIVEESLKCIQN